MKEDCLFGLEHLGCALAGNGDENEMFGFHDNIMFRYLTTTSTTLQSTPKSKLCRGPRRQSTSCRALRCCPFCGRVSIIMLQKVAATIKKVAADLCFMACEVR